MAKKMNGGLLFPMLFLYFLHFKMKQVQPLLMQTATGFVNLAYSPLFQVYVLGRNLERPFRPPVTANPMMEAWVMQRMIMQTRIRMRRGAARKGVEKKEKKKRRMTRMMYRDYEDDKIKLL